MKEIVYSSIYGSLSRLSLHRLPKVLIETCIRTQKFISVVWLAMYSCPNYRNEIIVINRQGTEKNSVGTYALHRFWC